MIYLVFAIAVIAVLLVVKGIKIVPQAENWIIERFGKYATTLNPGLNLINPIFSRVSHKVDIRETVLDMPKQGTITSDNASIEVDGIVYYKIMDPYKSYYGISSLRYAIQNLAQTTLRSIMGKMTLDESLSSREKINAELLEILDEATDSWGTKITRVEIRDIEPPADIVSAMTLQMKAEREKRARILEAEAKKEAAEREAEGMKRAQILQAEARKESADRDAEARERLARAEAQAISSVADSLNASGGDPLVYLLGQEYVRGMIKLGESPNGKIVVLPADVMESVKTIFKKQ
ncbi:MAG TPA: SPFH domain-containing protein [Spirochaetota bacterium]|nr:SPFH domain-containing protein [Spirochaetota bacterium]HPJ38088.1 SPFH domain-containing protein [Spirochaetota bacterium]HPQ51878.1 SPFH domain-containing protein [Spirochaetota bacterium]